MLSRLPQCIRLAPSARSRSILRVSAMGAQASKPVIHWDSKTCPYAQRSWITLLEKQVPFTVKLVDLANKSEEFTAKYASINPDPTAAAKVPILEDEDVQLVESMVICEYLESKHRSGTRLLPAAPAAAAKVRLFIDAFSSLFVPGLFAVFRAGDAEGVAAGREKLAAALRTLDAFIRQHGSSSGGDFFLGADYSFAEVATVGFIQRAAVALPAFRSVDLWAMVEEQGLDRLKAWMQASLARPSAVETQPADETIVASWQKFVTPMKS